MHEHRGMHLAHTHSTIRDIPQTPATAMDFEVPRESSCWESPHGLSLGRMGAQGGPRTVGEQGGLILFF